MEKVKEQVSQNMQQNAEKGQKNQKFDIKQVAKQFFSNKAVIWGIVLTVIYLASGFYKWIEIGVPVVAFFAFVFLPLQSGFCLFVYLHCFSLSSIGWYSTVLVTVICYSIVLFVKYLIGLKHKKYQFYKALAITISAFLLISICVSFFHLPINWGSVPFCCYLPLFYCIFAMRKEFNIHQAIGTLFFGLVLSSLLSLAFGFMPHFNYYPFWPGWRFTSFTNCPNYYYMRVFVVLTYVMYLNLNKNLSFLKFALSYVLCAIMILSTVSKTAMCLLALFTLIYLIVFLAQDFKRRYKYALIILAVIILAAAIGYKYILMVLHRFVDGSNHITLSSITTGRTDIWKVYLDAWLQNPATFLFGNGIFGARLYNPVLNHWYDTHSFVVMILYRFGFVGVLAIGAMVYLFIKYTNKKCPKFIAFLPLIWFLLESCVDNTFQVNNIFMLILVCMILYCNTPEENKPLLQNKSVEKIVLNDTQNDIKNNKK